MSARQVGRAALEHQRRRRGGAAGELDLAPCDGQRLTATVAGGEIELSGGAAAAPALVLEGESADLAALITGQLTSTRRWSHGAVRIEGAGRRRPGSCASSRCPSRARPGPIRRTRPR